MYFLWCLCFCLSQALHHNENISGGVEPVVDNTNCISCKRCQKVCPILSPLEYHTPKKAFAAWSANQEERRTSASGGIAAEVYKKAVEDNYYIAGAVQKDDFTVTLQVSKDEEAIEKFKNSKYVFSSAYSLYPQIRELLKQGEKVVIIGLPCQVAALRKIFKDDDNLLLMDVVCHGTTPYDYLMQHVHHLEQIYGKKAVKMYFRDPARKTNTFTFALYDEKGECFYAQQTKDGDTYQFGYHRTVTYRENCYHCHFARDRRISDVTLSDYKGLGKMVPCSYDGTKVSSVLVNTAQGEAFVRKLIDDGRIIAEERPVREPIEGDLQLRQPSQKRPARYDFERLIVENKNDFEKTMTEVMRLHYRREKINKIIKLPRRVLSKIKRIVLER